MAAGIGAYFTSRVLAILHSCLLFPQDLICSWNLKGLGYYPAAIEQVSIQGRGSDRASFHSLAKKTCCLPVFLLLLLLLLLPLPSRPVSSSPAPSALGKPLLFCDEPSEEAKGLCSLSGRSCRNRDTQSEPGRQVPWKKPGGSMTVRKSVAF